MVGLCMGLSACSSPSDAPKESPKIEPAPKLSNDATEYAQKAWQLINTLDPIVEAQQQDQLESVRQATRELSTEWRINVKMTDAVTEGKYALCRKALTSLEIYARNTLEQRGIEKAKADYQRDKAQCKGAIEHPEWGNTDPKQIGNAIVPQS